MDERLQGTETARPPSIGARLERHRAGILARWEEIARGRAKGRVLGRPILLDNIPDLLDRISAAADRGLDPGDAARPADAPAVAHALDRLEHGFDLEEVIDEYSALRQCILAALADAPVDAREVAVMDAMLDAAMSRAVVAYTAARERTLRAFDRIALAGATAGGVEQLVEGLLRVLVETAPAVDSAAVLLADGDRLELRAAIGIEQDLVDRFSLAIGEGFAGKIASERRPLELRSAATDDLVKSEALRLRGVRALYGVPLLDDEELVGVAHMGSTTAFEFGEEDKLLFRSLAVRATAFIQRARLLERERRAREAMERQAAELQRAEAFLAAERQWLTAVLDRMPTGVVLTETATGEVLLANVAAEAAPGGFPRELPSEAQQDTYATDATGRRIPNDEMPRFRVARGEKLTGYEMTWHWPGGSRTVLCSSESLPEMPGRPPTSVITFQDVTLRKRAEEEATRASAFRDRALAVVGHDLRNPLTAIRLSAGAVLPRATPEVARTVDRIARSALRMERIIADLVDAARAGYGGGLALSLRRADLGDVVRAMVEEYRVTHPGRDIALSAEGDLGGEWDPDRLAQLAGNLLQNALRYGREGSPVRVALAGAGDRVTLAVHNEGDPIPPEMMPHLFDPFRRGGTRAKGDAGHALGLGLYIVDAIVRAHAGEVEVTSTAEAGTAFTVRLPRRAATALSPPP